MVKPESYRPQVDRAMAAASAKLGMPWRGNGWVWVFEATDKTRPSTLAGRPVPVKVVNGVAGVCWSTRDARDPRDYARTEVMTTPDGWVSQEHMILEAGWAIRWSNGYDDNPLDPYRGP